MGMLALSRACFKPRIVLKESLWSFCPTPTSEVNPSEYGTLTMNHLPSKTSTVTTLSQPCHNSLSLGSTADRGDTLCAFDFSGPVRTLYSSHCAQRIDLLL